MHFLLWRAQIVFTVLSFEDMGNWRALLHHHLLLNLLCKSLTCTTNYGTNMPLNRLNFGLVFSSYWLNQMDFAVRLSGMNKVEARSGKN